jgi:hypothetical protein
MEMTEQRTRSFFFRVEGADIELWGAGARLLDRVVSRESMDETTETLQAEFAGAVARIDQNEESEK